MRLLLVLLFIFAAVIGLGFYINNRLEAATVEFVRDIDKIAGDVKEGDWKSANDGADRLESDWKKKAGWWPAVLDHQEIDNIEFAFSRVSAYLASRDAPLSRGQLSELRKMIKHIPEKEAVSLKNIF